MRVRRVRRSWLRLLAPFAGVVVLLAGGGFLALETESVQDYGDGVIWALSLMTTVGFVGGAPHTAGGKVIAAVLMLFGFGLLAMTTAAVASVFVQEDEEPAELRERAFEAEVLEALRELEVRLDRLDGRST